MTRADTTLDDLARMPDDAIDVARGAALIARDVYVNLDVEAQLARLDALATPLLAKGLETAPPRVQAEVLGRYFSEALGFHGNEGEFYDPRNSLLPDVLDRRLGIPITLSVVYCEIAKRVGVHARGVGFPGHFLARIDARQRESDESVILDPFHGARVLEVPELEALLKRSLGKDATLTRSHLAASSPRAILVRMLTNLKGIYASRGDFARAYLATSRIVSFVPSAVEALRERAALATRLGSHEAARADLARSLEIDGDSDDAAKARARLAELDAKRQGQGNRALN